MIAETINHIEDMIGIKLEPCDYFTGIQTNHNGEYFNAVMKDRCNVFNRKYNKLLNFAEKYKTIRVEPNGLRRIAIFVKTTT